ncbi:MAG: hypothetical protein PUC82_02675 [bacterium]|nr:hypothetical protein [bacterium]
MKKIIIITLMTLLIAPPTFQEVKKIISKNETNKENIQAENIALPENNISLIKEEVKVAETTNQNTQDAEIINYIDFLNEEITNLTSSTEKPKKMSSKLKSIFITLTDFVFYNGQINGVTFNDLTLSAKEKVLEIYSEIDQKIESAYPNYQEILKTKISLSSSSIKEKVASLKEDLAKQYQEKLGEETYNNTVEIFEEDINNLKETTTPTIKFFKDETKKTYENIKDKSNEWYQNFKESSD